MKRKLMTAALALCLACTSVGAFAEEETSEAATEAAADSEVTADSLVANKVLSYQSVSSDLSVNLDGALEITGEDTEASTLGFLVDGDWKFQMLNDSGYTFAVTGDTTFSLLGQEKTYDIEVYTTADPLFDTVDMYFRYSTGDTQSAWSHNQFTNDHSSESGAAVEEALENEESVIINNWDPEWNLEETDEGYLVTADVNLGSVLDNYQDNAEATAEDAGVTTEQLDTITSALDAITVHLELNYDKDTLAPTSSHADLNSTDFDALSDMIVSAISSGSDGETSADGISYKITMDNVSIDNTNMVVNTLTELAVPQEALDTPVTNDIEMSTTGADINADAEAEADTEAVSEAADTEAVTEAAS